MEYRQLADQQPQIGDRVLTVSGHRMGTVEGLNLGRFSISGWEGLWLDPSVVFHRQVTTVTLICEQEGLCRYGREAAVE